MIARVIHNNKLIGFRIVDTNTMNIAVIPYENVLRALKSGVTVENLCVEHGLIKGVSGNINRYTAINASGELISKQSIVFYIKRDSSDEPLYIFYDYLGNYRYMTSKDIGAYSQIGKVANAKILKTKDNKFYVSRIEGETISESIEIRTKTNKRYKIPKIIKGTQLSNPDKYFIVGSVEFKKLSAYRFESINIDAYKSKTGLGKKNIGNNKACHDIIYYQDKYQYLDILITELKFLDNSQFIFEVGNTMILVDDILYIGDAWRRVIDGESDTYSNPSDSLIIALGQLGLIIIKVDDHSKIEVKCIAYHLLTDINLLVNQLVKNAVTYNKICKEDVEYIIKAAKQCRYPITYDVDPYMIAERTSIHFGDADKEIGLEEVSGLDVMELNGYGAYIKDAFQEEAYINSFLRNELDLVTQGYLLTYVPSGSTTVLNLSQAKVKYCSIHTLKGHLNIKVEEVSHRLDYIGYFVLQKLGRIDNISNIWFSTSDKLLLSEIIWSTRIIGNKLHYFISKYRVTYDLQKLLDAYSKEMEESNEIQKASKKIQNKLGLVGGKYTVDDGGYIDDWEAGIVVEKIPNINGIKMTNDNVNKEITLYSDRVLDILYRTTVPIYWSSPTVKIVFNYSNRKLATKQFNRNVEVCMSLKDATAREAMEILAMYYRTTLTKDIVLKGELISIGIDTNEIDLVTMVANTNKIFESISAHKSDYIHLVDKDKMEESEKEKVVATCCKVLTRSKRKINDKSVELIYSIVNQLYSSQEASKLNDKIKRLWGST